MAEDSGFAQDEARKAQQLERVRARFAAATPATKRPALAKPSLDGARTRMAIFLMLVLLGAIVLGSGIF